MQAHARTMTSARRTKPHCRRVLRTMGVCGFAEAAVDSGLHHVFVGVVLEVSKKCMV